MDEFTIIIILAGVSFLALAAILLVPVYRFIQKEKEASKQWTKEEIARRSQEKPPRNGSDED